MSTITINRKPIPKEPNKMTPQYYWSKIKALCSLNRITQKELSESLEISEHTLSTYNKNADNIKLETICRFCTEYNIGSISELERF